MMGIYIKGMEMPKSCHACCFFGQADIWESDFDGYTKSFCKRTGSQTYDYVDKFLPNCPLVPVPPHGRLIDADALDNTLGIDDRDDYVHWTLESAPTIIPASGGSEDE